MKGWIVLPSSLRLFILICNRRSGPTDHFCYHVSMQFEETSKVPVSFWLIWEIWSSLGKQRRNKHVSDIIRDLVDRDSSRPSEIPKEKEVPLSCMETLNVLSETAERHDVLIDPQARIRLPEAQTAEGGSLNTSCISLVVYLFTINQLDFVDWIFMMAPLWSSKLLWRKTFECPSRSFTTGKGLRNLTHGLQGHYSYLLISRTEKVRN